MNRRMQGETEGGTPPLDDDVRRPKRAQPTGAKGVGSITEPMAWREVLGLSRRLLGDVFRRARSRVCAIFALNVIGVATRAASLGAMILYVEARTSSDSIRVGDFVLPSDASPTSLLFWATATLGSAAIAIAASIRADRLIFDTSREYMEAVMRSVLRDHAHGGDFLTRRMSVEPRVNLVAGILRGDSFRIVRMLLNLLSLPLPLITAVAAVGVLMATHATLSLALVPVFVLYMIIMRRLNLDVMRSEQRRREGARRLGADMRQVVRSIYNTRFPRGFEPGWLHDYPADAPVEAAMQGFRGVILARRRSGYLADGFQGLALFLVLVVFGALIAQSGTPWSLLLTYFVGLGFLTRSMSRASKFFTTTSRLLPATRRYVEFMQDAPGPVARIDAPSPLPITLCAGEPVPAGALLEWSLEPQSLVYCVTGEPFRHSGIDPLFGALAGGDAKLAAALSARAFVSIGSAPALDRPFGSLLPSDDSWGRIDQGGLDEFLDRIGVAEEWKARFPEPDPSVAPQDVPLANPLLETALRLMPGLASRAELLVLDARPLDALEPAARAAVLDALANRCVIIVADSLPDWPQISCDAVVLVKEGGIRSIGDLEWGRGDVGRTENALLREESRADSKNPGSQGVEDGLDPAPTS